MYEYYSDDDTREYRIMLKLQSIVLFLKLFTVFVLKRNFKNIHISF